MSIPAQSNSLESQVDRRGRWASFCLRDHSVQPWEKRNFLVETQAQLERAASQKTVLSAIFNHLICSIFNESPLGMRIKGASPLRVPSLFASPSHVTFSREHRCFFDSMAHMAARLLGLPVLALRLRVIRHLKSPTWSLAQVPPLDVARRRCALFCKDLSRQDPVNYRPSSARRQTVLRCSLFPAHLGHVRFQMLGRASLPVNMHHISIPQRRSYARNPRTTPSSTTSSASVSADSCGKSDESFLLASLCSKHSVCLDAYRNTSLSTSLFVS